MKWAFEDTRHFIIESENSISRDRQIHNIQKPFNA